ncbi:hypothetical protein QCA50_020009 [Cerrena zonata]|uniref:Restriction endonuclease n=1 Tax=Cerrena zonata TaxID=2478898 RepID=A0AAW0FE51_9APHY
MYLSLDLQTEDTISAGEHELLQYSALIQSYAAETDTTKNWNFPKNHTYKHAFSDIRSKGVTRNYNTKPNEKIHRLFKTIYKFRTNFKDIKKQITEIEHNFLIADTIRGDLALQDSYNNRLHHKAQKALEEPLDQFERIYLGAKENPTSLRDLQESHANDSAFSTFRTLLSTFMNNLFVEYNIPLPNGSRITLKPEQKSIISSKSSMSPMKIERFDHILVNGGEKNFFAKLILLFAIKLDNKDYPLALIQPLDRSTGVQRHKNKDLRFYRIGAQPRNKAEVISVHFIIRGAYVVPDFERETEFLVVDTIDGDMFLQLQDIFYTD